MFWVLSILKTIKRKNLKDGHIGWNILRVYKDGQTVGYSFLPPKKFKPTSQSSCCTKHLHGISCSSGYERYTELEKKILINLEASETEFFAKVNEKCKIVRIFGNKEYKLG